MVTNDPVILDYRRAKHVARAWARNALELKAAGLPWAESARLAHEALAWALLIIR